MKYALSCLAVMGIILMASVAFAVTSPDRTDDHFVQTHNLISQYGDIIANAADVFDIPHQILMGVILVESGGNAQASTNLSSAKGLMQTIDLTFEEAYKSLTASGITLENNPFNPRSSILAGAFYLDKMYNRAVSENRMPAGKRHRLTSWRIPLTYYYAGPVHGAKQENFIRVCSRGKCRIIDKNRYASNVLTMASGFFPRPLPAKSPRPVIRTSQAPARKPGLKKKLLPLFSKRGLGFVRSADKGFD